MMSLDNVFNFDELQGYFDRVAKSFSEPELKALKWVFELKIDGLAISAIYRHGHLVTAATRGNGRVGEDVTANILAIEAIPRTLVAKDLGTPPRLVRSKGGGLYDQGGICPSQWGAVGSGPADVCKSQKLCGRITSTKGSSGDGKT